MYQLHYILGIVAEMERKQIKERQREGIQLAKLRGVYKGRANGSKEDIRKFLSKPKVAKTIDYLKKGYKASEISRIVGIHVNTITKVKKITRLIQYTSDGETKVLYQQTI